MLCRACVFLIQQVTRQFSILSPDANVRTIFGVSFDEKYIAVGGGNGSVSIYNIDVSAGDENVIAQPLTVLRNTRSWAPITCCAFSKNGNQLLASSTDCSVWRWDVVVDQDGLLQLLKNKKNEKVPPATPTALSTASTTTNSVPVVTTNLTISSTES